MPQPLLDAAAPASLAFEAAIDIVPLGTVSKTLLSVGSAKQVLFAMDKGQELTEHTAPVAATIQVLGGRLRVGVGGRPFDLPAGHVVLMPANVPHAVAALEPTRFLLTMIRP